MSLQDEIEDARQTIRSESYAMSIGEIVNLYRDEEIVIRPEFQRLYRWKQPQKSRLIESVMLGIPLPSIFVMQRESGTWELIDGLQRLSTIFEFMGELRNEATGELEPPLTLSPTRYLPSLAGITYEGVDETKCFTAGQRLALKRAKIDVKILLPESNETAKYELFDRLNAGGTVATRQEVRTAQLILRDPSMWEWLKTLLANGNYTDTLSISERLFDEGYDIELVCRYLALRYSYAQVGRNPGNIDEFLSEQIFAFAGDLEFDRVSVRSEFAELFELINRSLGDEAFKRYDSSRGAFRGAFSVAAFECITVGIAHHLSLWSNIVSKNPAALRARVQALWDTEEFLALRSGGVSASSRIPRVIPLGIEFFGTAD